MRGPVARSVGHRMGERAGVLLDLTVAVALILLGAFLLALVGISFSEILHGAERFFGR